MKLLTRYNRANYITAIIILIASSVSYYFIIRTILLKQLDKDLKVEEQEINEYVNEKQSLPNATAYHGQEIKFEVAKTPDIKREITSSTLFMEKHGEDNPVRILTFPIRVNGVLHKAMVIKSQVEAEDLLEVIVLVTAAIILVMLIVISLINRFLLAKLWQPFYKTLKELRTFDVKNAKALELPATKIEEFNELNASVSVMTKRINEEFETLKAFTDNASHEMQTPLAIINSKLDILLQSCTEKQADQLQSIYNATGRLSKLNQTLLLLTKISNDQYKNQQRVDLRNLMEQKFMQFEELINGRNLKLTYELEDASLYINEELVDILLNNLLSNAIKHNFEGGFIHCTLTTEKLSVTNSGPSLTFENAQIFDRFQKSNHSDGSGLGLAVARQICESNGHVLGYYNKRSAHTFTIVFKSR